MYRFKAASWAIQLNRSAISSFVKVLYKFADAFFERSYRNVDEVLTVAEKSILAIAHFIDKILNWGKAR